VIQFPEELFASHDEVVAFEQRIGSYLPATCELDGHDIGSGTTNFFIYTAYPVAAYKILLRVSTRATQAKMRIAYRSTAGSTFTNLWPRRDPRPFEYMYSADDNPFARGAKRKIPRRSPRGVRAK